MNNREIKFRVWNKLQEKMFDWDVLCNAKKGAVWQWINLNHTEEHNILMQFTGLKDKNGVEIYEGDILKLTHRTYWDFEKEDTARYEDIVYLKCNDLNNTKCYYCSTNEKWDNGHSYYDWDDDWSIETEHIEVLSNIYQNPELLTVN